MTTEPQPHQGGARGGRGLRLARQARGFSQQQLAGMAGVSRQAVSAVESGLSDPSLRVALALSRALGLTVEELFGPAIPEPVVSVRSLAPLGKAGSPGISCAGRRVARRASAGRSHRHQGRLRPGRRAGHRQWRSRPARAAATDAGGGRL